MWQKKTVSTQRVEIFAPAERYFAAERYLEASCPSCIICTSCVFFLPKSNLSYRLRPVILGKRRKDNSVDRLVLSMFEERTYFIRPALLSRVQSLVSCSVEWQLPESCVSLMISSTGTSTTRRGTYVLDLLGVSPKTLSLGCSTTS